MTTQSQSVREAAGIHPGKRTEVGQYPKPLSSGTTVEMVRQSVEELLTHLNTQIKRTEQLIRDHINKHPRLKQQRDLLDSIPGIAETTAAH